MKNEKILDNKLKTVQYWGRGVLLTSDLDIEVAKKLVKEKKCFIISSQAIKLIEDRK